MKALFRLLVDILGGKSTTWIVIVLVAVTLLVGVIASCTTMKVREKDAQERSLIRKANPTSFVCVQTQ